MSEELKPCPICGDTSTDYYYHEDDAVGVICRKCGFEIRDDRGEESAFRDWNALPRRLRWSKVKPTEPGFWFCRYGVTVGVFNLVWENGRLAAIQEQHPASYVDEAEGFEWAGPIPEPEDDK